MATSFSLRNLRSLRQQLRIEFSSASAAATLISLQLGLRLNQGSTVEPWFNLNPNYTEINVAQAEKDENSILNYYRKLLKFRKEHEVAIYGDFKQYYENSDKLFVYERTLENEKILVVCSFSEKGVNFEAPAGYDLSKGELVLSNYRLNPVTHNSFVTRPYEARVYYFK